MAEKNMEENDIELQRKIDRQKRLAEKRKLEEANLTEEEKQKRLKERRKAALQKKLEGLSEEEKKKVLEERRQRAKQKKLEAQAKEREILKDSFNDNELKEGDVSVKNIETNEEMNKNKKKVNSKTKKADKQKVKMEKKKAKLIAKSQKKGKGKKIAFTIIAILLIILILAGVFIGKRIKDNGGGVQGIVATMLGHDSDTLKNLPELRFLIIGESQNLTDTIMVCSYNPRSQKASILSIPRDTFTGKNKSSASPYEKINTLYGQSPDKLLKEVNTLTGLDIKYYVHVDTKGLVDLVDAIGGIEFDVPTNMNYDDSSQKLYIHLNAGNQMLDGKKAEQLVRFRHNNNGTTYPSEYGQEDIGRMKTQREFIKAVVKKMARAENITKIDDFITIGNKYVKTNMDFNAFKDYAPYALSFNSDNIRTETLPGVPEKINGYWFYSCNKKETQTLVADMFNLEPVDNVEVTEDPNSDLSKVNVKGVKVEILNGTSDSKNLTNLKTTLQKAGFTVSKTGTTSKTTKTTIVNRTSKSDDIAKKLKSTVGAGAISTGSNNSGVDFTIVIGSDFNIAEK